MINLLVKRYMYLQQTIQTMYFRKLSIFKVMMSVLSKAGISIEKSFNLLRHLSLEFGKKFRTNGRKIASITNPNPIQLAKYYIDCLANSILKQSHLCPDQKINKNVLHSFSSGSIDLLTIILKEKNMIVEV